MNVVIMVGRLTRDPELRFIAGSGKAVATFAIAVDRPFSKEKTADFFNVVVWGKPAENAAKYLAKGKQVAVKGYMMTRNFDDKEGVKRYVTELVADEVQFIDFADKKEFNQMTVTKEHEIDGFEQIEDDSDIPF